MAAFSDSPAETGGTWPDDYPRPGRGVLRSLTIALALVVSGGFIFARLAQPALSPPTAEEVALARTELVTRRTVETGTFLSAGVDGPAVQTLGLGFLHPDASGAWMAQLSANIQFAVAPGATPVSLELELRPLVAASDRERQVTVSSSIDEVVTRLTGGRQSILVALDGGVEQAVTISCDRVDSPIGLKLGPDRRAFCAFVTGYTVNAEGA